MRKTILLFALLTLSQVASAQLDKVTNGLRALEVILSSSKSIEASATALSKTAGYLGVSASQLKTMTAAERKLKLSKLSESQLAEIKDFAFKIEKAEASGAKGFNNVVQGGKRTEFANIYDGVQLPGKTAKGVEHDLTLANAEALNNVKDPHLRSALKDNLIATTKLEQEAQKRGLSIVNKDGRVLCERLSDVNAVRAKTNIDKDVLLAMKNGEIKNSLEAGQIYARELSEEVGVSLKEGKRRVIELSKPAKEGGHCELGSRSMYLALLNAA